MKKKIILVSILVLGLLGIINFNSVSKSNSKYYDDTKSALAFTNMLYDVYNPKDINVMYLENMSNPDTFYFHFYLRRNTKIGEDVLAKDDSYIIDVPNGCTLSIMKSDESKIITHSDDYKKLTLNIKPSNPDKDAEDMENSIEMNVACPTDDTLKDDKGRYILKIKIYEQIKDEDKFLYRKGESDFVLELPSDKSLTTYTFTGPKENVYEELEKFVNNYVDYTFKNDDNRHGTAWEAIANYIKVYENEGSKDASVAWTDGGLLGLKIEHTPNTDTYTFTIEDDLAGYARTKQGLENSLSRKIIYFYKIDNPYILEKVFKNMLNSYFYPLEEDYNIIINYLNYVTDNNIGIFLLEGNYKISNLNWTKDNDGCLQIFISVDNLLTTAREWDEANAIGDDVIDDEEIIPPVEEGEDIPIIDEEEQGSKQDTSEESIDPEEKEEIPEEIPKEDETEHEPVEPPLEEDKEELTLEDTLKELMDDTIISELGYMEILNNEDINNWYNNPSAKKYFLVFDKGNELIDAHYIIVEATYIEDNKSFKFMPLQGLNNCLITLDNTEKIDITITIPKNTESDVESLENELINDMQSFMAVFNKDIDASQLAYEFVDNIDSITIKFNTIDKIVIEEKEEENENKIVPEEEQFYFAN